MKQLFPYLFLGLFFQNTSFAQIHVPDVNFANAIRSTCPSCIDANNDLLAPSSSLTSLNIAGQNISNLQGIEGFTAVTDLFCHFNNLTMLPPLPNSITMLEAGNNELTSLPTLPSNLDWLGCGNNLLTGLPPLPNTLLHLDARSNNLLSLPPLPNNMTQLNLEFNPNLTCLPFLPNSLTSIGFSVYMTAVTCIPNPISASTLPVCSSSNNANQCINYAQLAGTVYLDNNSDCSFNVGSDNAAAANVLVLATDAQNNVFHTYTNAAGQYIFALPVNQYSVQVVPNPNHFYTLCAASSINIATSTSFVTANLGMQTLVSCPLMEVEIDAHRLRRCFSGNYMVTYRNRGTAIANNAYIDVTLDNFLTYNSNSLNLTPTNLGNNVYRFNIGNVGISQQNSFTIGVSVSCSADLGQVHCTEAHIYPDVVCNLGWTDPIIEITDTCLVDTVVFRLTNTGSNMLTSQTYRLLEDNLLYIPNTTFQLNAGQFLDVPIPAAPNKIYRIEVEQATNFPVLLGDSEAWAVVQNCNGVSNVNPNFINQFYTENSALAISNDCSPNSGSFDPNAKSAQLVGYGSQHLIPKNTPLEYKIEFQNTGTDTAFRVVVLDTLDSNVLDITSIELGNSSHNYQWRLLENHILEFAFDGILLADSLSNEAASHGFVSFKIKQQPNLTNGTIINNNAAIYFDNNTPVITNTCFHTIGENFIVLANKDISMPNADVKVYPNPFQTQTTFEVSGVQYQQLMLKLTDVLGNEVTTIQTSNNQLQLDRNQLPSGMYFYQLYVDDVLLNTGKIIAQ